MDIREEVHNNRLIACGIIYPSSFIQPGQFWQASGGSIVEITSMIGDKVSYKWDGGSHCKDAFAFQCRYCFVIKDFNKEPE